MRHSLEAVDLIWGRINTYYKGFVSGGIYKLTRPFGSKVEDIVINALSITTESIQKCVVNVNCYVPDLVANIQGKSTSMANTKRIKDIANDLVDMLSDYAGDGYYFYLQNQNVLQADENQHYINLRIEVLFTNENN